MLNFICATLISFISDANTKQRSRRDPNEQIRDFRCTKSRFEHLKTSSLALPPTTQWGSEEPLSRITKDARLQESHLVRTRLQFPDLTHWHWKFETLLKCNDSNNSDNKNWELYSSAITVTIVTNEGREEWRDSLFRFKLDKCVFVQNVHTVNLQILIIL